MIKKICLAAFLTLMCVAALTAQQLDYSSRIPADPDVRVGQLDNGMRYYIRHNDQQEKMADFYIYHNVGAIEEEDTQTGLAHFLEHMAFNGTKNLPEKTMINYLEKIGVKFGLNLNAGTAQDFTFYRMSDVPVTRQGIIDTALLILHDWSHFITLDPVEIDNERGVIIEELRTTNNSDFRVRNLTDPTRYNGSRYAYRNVIGDEQQLRTFAHQEIVDFYHRWYRPDLQTLIIVGDINVSEVEAQIIELMKDIPAVENPEPKVSHYIPTNIEPLIAVAVDPELRYSSVEYMIRREALPNEVNDIIGAAKINTILALADRMAQNRIAEMVNSANAPFINAVLGNWSLTNYNDVIYGNVIAREGETASAFEAFYTEVEKIRRFGYNESEFERAQSELLREAQKKFDSSGDRKNQDYIWLYINNFVKNEPIPSAEVEWTIDSALIASTMLIEVNMMMQELLTPVNQSVIVTAPDKAGVYVPTVEDVQAILNRVHNAELEPYADNVVREPLISEDLTGSPVVKTEKGQYESTVMTLANGAQVIIKPTDFKSDEVLMRIESKGGLSILSDDEHITGSIIPDLVYLSGVSKFSAIDLQKQLSGKLAGVYANVGEYTNGFNGSASVKDFETLLQLTYLYFTQPRFTREDFDMMIDKYKTGLENMSTNPDYIFMDSLRSTMYDHNIRRKTITYDRIGEINFDRVAEIYNELYRNSDDFTFTFVGNIDPETARPLIEKYIGSLPATKEVLNAKDDNVRVVKGLVENTFRIPMQSPKTTVAYVYNGEVDFNLANALNFNVLGQLLDIRYIETIREEKGGTYGVGVDGNISKDPVNTYSLVIKFDTDPNLVDELTPIVEEELENIALNGPSEQDMSKIKEFMVKQRTNDLRNNNIWLSYVSSYYTHGIDFASDYMDELNKVTPATIQAVAQKILADGNLVKVIMYPEN